MFAPWSIQELPLHFSDVLCVVDKSTANRPENHVDGRRKNQVYMQ